MKVVQVNGYGGVEQLEVVERPVPTPRAGEVLIEVKACGINNTEIWMREGAYGTDAQSGWKPEGVQFPRVPGSDISGRIVQVGSGVDEARNGQDVVLFPFTSSGQKERNISVKTWRSSDQSMTEDMPSMSFGRQNCVMRCRLPIIRKVLFSPSVD